MTRTTSPWLRRLAPIVGVTAIVAALLTPAAAVAEQTEPAASDSSALETLTAAYEQLLPLIEAGETSGSTQPIAADTSSKRAARRDIGSGVTGFVLAAGDPIVDAAVYVYPADGSSGYIATTTTNDDGEFTLAVAPGQYKLYVVPATGSEFAPQWYGGSATQSDATVVTVLEDGPLATADVSLERGATIVGRVTGEDLVAPNDALPGTMILIAQENGGGQFVEADENGEFGIAGVPDIPLLMLAVDISQPAKYQVQLWEDSTDFEHLVPFTLEPGELAIRDFDMHVGATLSGLVSGSEAPTVGIPDVEVYPSGALIFVGGAYTDEDGRYVIGGIIPGEYPVGYFPSNDDDYNDQYWKNAATEEAATPIVFGTREAVTANVQLVPIKSVEAGTATITGTPTSGSTLTAVSGNWTPSSVALSYQWLADSKPISGATHSTLKLNNSTAGKRISVTVTGKKAAYNSASVTSAKTAIVDGGIFSVASPKVIGNPAIGKTLRVDRGYWGTSTASFSYSWKRNGSPIAGATGTTYKATKADAGKKLTVAVTASATGFVTATVATPATTIGKPLVATPNPTVKGTHKVGKKLTAKSGKWKPAGVKFSYRWLRDGKTIEGATSSTYKVKSADKGHRVSVVLTGSKSGYTSVSKWSASKKVR